MDDEEQTTDFPEITHLKKRAFLAAYAKCGSVTKASEIAGITRRTHQNWLNDQRPEGELYRKAFSFAKEQACELLEDEARRRAFGYEEPVIYQGSLSGCWIKDGMQVTEGTPGATLIPLTVRKYSDTLLMCLLNGNMPHKFRNPKAPEQVPPEKPDDNRPLDEVMQEMQPYLQQADEKTKPQDKS